MSTKITYGELKDLMTNLRDHCKTYKIKLDRSLPIEIGKDDNGQRGVYCWIKDSSQ